MAGTTGIVDATNPANALKVNPDGSINSNVESANATDTFNPAATNITAATTFSGVPTVSQLVASSFVLLANPGDQATFLAQISVASAFVGTLSFYGLEIDGTTLQLLSAHQRGTSTIASSTAISTGVALNQVWAGNIATFKAIYVVCTAFTSGSVAVQLGLSAAPYALIITNANANGQNTMTNSQSVTMASDQSPIPMKGGFAELPSLAAGSLNADLVPATDVSAYKSLSLHINANAYVGTLTFQGSNDNVNWVSVNLARLDNSGITSTTAATNLIFAGPVLYRWFRVRMTAYTSGTAQGTLELYNYPFSEWTFNSVTLNAAANSIGTVQPGNTQNTTPWLWARANTTVLNQASAAQTATGNSADLPVGAYDEISLDINITANSGTNQTIQFFWDRKGADGIYYPIWQSNTITTTNQALSTSIGVGMAYAQSLGTTGRLRWVIGGTSPSFTFSASVIGK